VQSSPIRDVDKLYFAPLPFYNIQQVIMEPRTLTSKQPTNEGMMHTIIEFEIPLDVNRKVSKSTDDPLPRYEIQLRFTSNHPDHEQVDIYPKNLNLLLNNTRIKLPKTYMMPSTQLLYKPVNLTSYFRGRNQKLLIQWNDDREFALGIWFVQRINSTMQHDQLLETGPSLYEETREQIKLSLGQNSDEISMDSLKISLLCPLSRTKLVTPVRSHTCRHFQCFDLFSFLSMHEERLNWKCPICNSQISYDSLVVDRYFLEIVDGSGGESEIELLPNGDWKIATKAKTIEYEVDDEIETPNTSNEQEIITIDDSEDEETEVSSINGQASRKRMYDQISAADYEIITLDDED